jgi:hypothetical protein
VVHLSGIVLPEFSHLQHTILHNDAFLFDNDQVKHDIIFGRNFFNQISIIIDHKDYMLHWQDASVGFKPDVLWLDSARSFLELSCLTRSQNPTWFPTELVEPSNGKQPAY